MSAKLLPAAATRIKTSPAPLVSRVEKAGGQCWHSTSAG
jgi:hypothetical protein